MPDERKDQITIPTVTMRKPSENIEFSMEWYLTKAELAAEGNLPISSNLRLLRLNLQQVIQQLKENGL